MKIYIYEKLDTDFRIDYYSGIGFPQDRRVLHSHPYHEFSLIDTGDINYVSNNCVDHVTEKCFIFSCAYQLHNPYVNQQKPYRRYQIMFKTNFLSSFLPEYRSIFSPVMSRSSIWRVPDHIYDRMKIILEALYDRYNNRPDSKTAFLEYRLLTAELMLLATDVASASSTLEAPGSGRYIDDVIRHIQQHYAGALALDDLSARFFVSRTKLANDFKKHVGMTIGSFITLTRIEAAKSLLRQGYSVHNTAALCGYPGVSYFIKTFYSYTRMTPLKFQQQLNEDID